VENAVKLWENEDKFTFTVESVGSLPPVEIVKKAMAILKTKIISF